MDQILKIRNLVLLCCLLNISVNCHSSSVLLDKAELESSNCTITPTTAESKLLLEKYINDDENRLISLKITVQWNNLTGNDSYPGDLEWYMTTSQSGKRLLLLEKYFEQMSLGTLSHGLKTMLLDLEQRPFDCLSAYTPEKAYDVIYYNLLTLPTRNKTTKDDEDEDYNDLEVCNGYSETPVCCRLTLLGNLECDEHVADKWSTILNVVLVIIIFLLVSVSLKFVPRSWYESDNSVFEFIEGSSRQIMFSVIEECANHTDLKNFQERDNSKQLKDLFCKIPEKDKKYKIRAGVNKIFAETDQLVSSVKQPLGLKYFLSRLMPVLSYICFTCRIRNINLVLKWLCYKELCCKLHLYQWTAKILKILLFLLFFLALLLPRGIYCWYNGSFSLWVTLLCFFILSFLYRPMFFHCDKKNKVRVFMKKCFQYTLNQRLSDRLWRLKKIVFPKRFESQIVIRFFWALFLSVPLIIYLCISFFPSAHFVLIQMVNITQLTKSKSYIIFFFILNLTVLVVFFSVVIDLISFYVLCFSYIFIGFIVNGSTVLPYATFILLMCSYIYDCFHDTHKKVDEFKKTVFQILNEIDKKSVKRMYNLSKHFRKNLFFFLRLTGTETESDPAKPFISLNGKICWLATRVPFFYKVDNTDKLPYLHIPELFLYLVMEYPSKITPGSIYKMYRKNVRDVLIMLSILSAALYAINSFGNVHKLSSVVKSLITVGSGVVAFIFSKLLSRTNVYEVDDKDLKLEDIIKKVSKNYSELWKIEDYTDISVTETDSGNEVDIIGRVQRFESTFYVNNSICQINSESTNDEESSTCCELCCGCIIVNIFDDHNGYEVV